MNHEPKRIAALLLSFVFSISPCVAANEFDTLRQKAFSAAAQGKFADARQLYESAIQQSQQSSFELAACFEQLAELYANAGDFAKAEQSQRSAIATYTKVSEDSKQFKRKNQLAMILDMAGKQAESQALLLEVMRAHNQVNQAPLPKKDPAIVKDIHKLGLLYLNSEPGFNFQAEEEAEPLLKRVYQKNLTQYKSGDPRTIESAIDLAKCFAVIDKHSENKAQSHNDEVTSMLNDCTKAAPSAFEAFKAQAALANYIVETDRHHDVEQIIPALIERAAKLQTPDKTAAAKLLFDLAEKCITPGAFALAADLLQQVMLMADQKDQRDEKLMNSARFSLLRTYKDWGQPEKSESFLMTAYTKGNEQQGPQSEQASTWGTMLASYYGSNNQWPKAVPILENLDKAALQSQKPQDSIKVTSLLEMLARAYSEIGKPDQAEKQYQRAIKIWEGAKNPGPVLGVMQEYSNFIEKQGRKQEASDMRARMMSMFKEQAGGQHMLALPSEGDKITKW